MKWTLFWASTLGLIGTTIYLFRKELGLVPTQSTPKVSSSLVFSAQANALVLDELQKSQERINELEGQTEIVLIANSTMSVGDIVCIFQGKASIYNPNDDNINNLPIGVVKNYATGNSQVRVGIAGKVDGFSGIVPDAKYYAGPNGTITTTTPTSGMLRSVGFGINSTSLMLDFSQKIEL